MIEFALLASGSKANSVVIQSAKTRILVDCGLSARETAKRLQSLGIAPETIQAIVISHEHSDHIAGVRVFAGQTKCMVFANEGTLGQGNFVGDLSGDRLQQFESGRSFVFQDLCFESFSVEHDAADPVAFRVSDGEHVLGIVTDLGHVTELVRERVQGLHGLVLEHNHDPELLNEAPYPWELKQRIRSRKGHLSNDDASKLLEELASETLSRLEIVVAAHLSEKSNHPSLVEETIATAWQRSEQRNRQSSGALGHPKWAIASQHQPTPWFSLGALDARAVL